VPSSYWSPRNILIQDSGTTMALSNPTLKYFKRKTLPMADVWGETVKTKETRKVIAFMKDQGLNPPNPADPNFGSEVNRTKMRLKREPQFREADLSQVDWADVALAVKPITIEKVPSRPVVLRHTVAEMRRSRGR